jgi:hypothetical protein
MTVLSGGYNPITKSRSLGSGHHNGWPWTPHSGPMFHTYVRSPIPCLMRNTDEWHAGERGNICLTPSSLSGLHKDQRTGFAMLIMAWQIFVIQGVWCPPTLTGNHKVSPSNRWPRHTSACTKYYINVD